MLCYINRSVVLEQSICHLIKQYLNDLNVRAKYPNFNITVTCEHPFARLYFNDNLQASDSFPCVVVSTQEDKKPSDFMELPPHTDKITLEKKDIDALIASTKDTKAVGLCTVIDNKTLEAITNTIQEKGCCYGYSIRTRRQDALAVEVWAENVQLKNELYEQLRLYIAGSLRYQLDDMLSFFDIALFDDTIVGHKSNNYNYDFDIALCGAHIAFDVNYCTETLILDTEAKNMNFDIENMIMEAKNYV